MVQLPSLVAEAAPLAVEANLQVVGPSQPAALPSLPVEPPTQLEAAPTHPVEQPASPAAVAPKLLVEATQQRTGPYLPVPTSVLRVG